MTKIDDIIIGSEVSTDVHKDYGNSGILVAIMHYSNLDYALIQYKKNVSEGSGIQDPSYKILKGYYPEDLNKCAWCLLDSLTIISEPIEYKLEQIIKKLS